MNENLEMKMRYEAAPAHTVPFGQDVLAVQDAIDIAREHAEARARPLREALERVRPFLLSWHADARAEIDAALAAEAQHRGDAIKVTGVDYGHGPSRTVRVEMRDGVITSSGDAKQSAEGGR